MRNTFIDTLTAAGYKHSVEDGAHLWVLGKIEVVVTDGNQIIIFDGARKIGTYDTFTEALYVLNLG